MNKSLPKRTGKPVLGIIILLVVILLAIYWGTRPRLAPLTDIQNIGTLRTQFNQDIGKTRLILLVSPT